MYKRFRPPDRSVAELTAEDFKIDRVFVHYDSINMRPMCLVHQRWLFIIISGYKSFAFDFITHRHIEFPKLPLLSKHSASIDAKLMVLNDRDLFVLNASRNKN